MDGNAYFFFYVLWLWGRERVNKTDTGRRCRFVGLTLVAVSSCLDDEKNKGNIDSSCMITIVQF